MAKKKGNDPLSPVILPANQKLTFSFEYYDKSSDKYCISKWTQEQIRNALGRMQDICTKSFNQLTKERDTYHFYEVDWSRTVEKQGFSNQAVNRLPPFHFALLGVNRQLTRVFGAYSSGIFYIVWFDLNHDIWPVELKHT